VSLLSLSSFALPAALLFSSEEGEHASSWLGLPITVWQAVNLILFLAVLVYFVAKPMSAAFRKRQDEIEERRREAEKQKAAVERLSADIRERTAKLEREIEEIRKQGVVEGQAERAELAARADEEVARVGRETTEEIGRRVAAAREDLKRAAADLTASTAETILAREINDADRQRLLTESVETLKASR
jgi:F0F1-type ATP synthase membrane subunit b/b'